MAADPDTSANETGILRDLDRVARSPISPDPNRLVRTKSFGEEKLKRIEDASLTNKIFDFTNQLNDLKVSAKDHRSSNSRRGSHASMNSNSLSNTANKLKGVKKLGSLLEKEEREKEKAERDRSARSKASADIIITRELDEKGQQTGKSHRSDTNQ